MLPDPASLPAAGQRILLVNHEDSFVHTLAGYFRELGAEVRTILGHQGIGDYFGARLGVLSEPLHGKERETVVVPGGFLDGLPDGFPAGRYHSLYVEGTDLPDELMIAATDSDGVIMALQHRGLPVFGVQFHPESIMTSKGESGRRLIAAVLRQVLDPTGSTLSEVSSGL